MAATGEGNDVGALDLAAEWRSMQRRMVDHLERGTKTDLADGVLEVDARVYTDPVRLEAERERIFREIPLLVGFSGELEAPGEEKKAVQDDVEGVSRAMLVVQCGWRRLVCDVAGWINMMKVVVITRIRATYDDSV